MVRKFEKTADSWIDMYKREIKHYQWKIRDCKFFGLVDLITEYEKRIERAKENIAIIEKNPELW